MQPTRLLTSGEAGVRVGMTQGQIGKLCKRGKVPFTLAGGNRLFRESDLPKLKQAGVEAGYVRAIEPATATA